MCTQLVNPSNFCYSYASLLALGWTACQLPQGMLVHGHRFFRLLKWLFRRPQQVQLWSVKAWTELCASWQDPALHTGHGTLTPSCSRSTSPNAQRSGSAMLEEEMRTSRRQRKNNFGVGHAGDGGEKTTPKYDRWREQDVGFRCHNHSWTS